jgi:hypothetical protein
VTDPLRRVLRDAPIPGEHDARVRAWEVVSAAFAERERTPWPRRHVRPLVAAAVALAVVAAAFSPPGGAVLHSLRKAIGVEGAQQALFRLPAPGRLLVESAEGPWVVQEDGSKRLLGPYREASWSPHGLFVAVARRDELAAVETEGSVHWTLSRRDVRFPSWTGTHTDTRIAYLSGSRLHVVGGDGRGDVDAGGLPAAARVAPAWRPGLKRVVAYVDTRGRVYAYDADSGSLEWRSQPFPHPRLLTWSDDGSLLLLVTRERLVLFRGGRPSVVAIDGAVDAAFAPRSHTIAVVQPTEVLLLDGDVPAAQPVRLFAGSGPFAGAAWSPDGRWLLVSWPAADQWVFVRAGGLRRIEAVSNISEQFGGSFPRLAGWCCR